MWGKTIQYYSFANNLNIFISLVHFILKFNTFGLFWWLWYYFQPYIRIKASLFYIYIKCAGLYCTYLESFQGEIRGSWNFCLGAVRLPWVVVKWKKKKKKKTHLVRSSHSSSCFYSKLLFSRIKWENVNT